MTTPYLLLARTSSSAGTINEAGGKPQNVFDVVGNPASKTADRAGGSPFHVFLHFGDCSNCFESWYLANSLREACSRLVRIWRLLKGKQPSK